MSDLAGGLLLGAEHLRWEHGRWVLRAPDVAICPAWPSALRLRASRGWRHPRGRRLHLTWPVLRVGGVPVAALPYLAVPLEPGVSGLLPPSVGYSARDGLRLGQGAYLAADRVELEATGGWVQRRGGFARARLGVALPRGGGGQLRWMSLHDAPRWRHGLWGRLHYRSAGLSFGFSPHWSSDGDLWRDLASDPARVLAPFQISRLWGAVTRGPLVLSGDVAAYQRLGPRADERVAGGLSVGLGGISLGPVSLRGEASLRFVEGVDDAVFSSLVAPDIAQGGGWLARLAPALGLVRPVGPLIVAASLAYHLRGFADGAGALSAAQAGVGRLSLSLPFERSYGRWVHRVEPSVGAVAAQGELLGAQLFDILPLRRVGAAEVALTSSLVSISGPPRHLRGRLRGLYDLAADGRLTIDTSLSASLAAVDASLRALVEGREGSLLWLEARLCVGPSRVRGCAGFLRQQRAELWPLLGSEGLAPTTLALPGAELRRIHGGLRLRLGPLSGGADVFVDPRRPRLTHGSYWLGYQGSCFEASVRGRSFLQGRHVPDLMLVLALRRPEVAACLQGLGGSRR